MTYQRKYCGTIKMVQTTLVLHVQVTAGLLAFQQQSDCSTILIGMCTTCAKIPITIIEFRGKEKNRAV